MTKTLVQQAKVRTNTVKDSVCKINVPAVKFADLWDNYVTGDPYNDPTGEYENQCAIRMSATFHKVGIEMKSFSEKTIKPMPGKKTIGRILLNGKATATRAQELAEWLKLQPFCGLPKQPENITGKDWVEKVKGRTGIIMFDGYWTRDGESSASASGGHIDLWNGEKLTGFGTGLRVRWNIVIRGIWSDFRNSKTILFFPIQ
ncbi:type VI secretion system amidase effector protein Tae4 [Cupriavidus pauculus]|uniref:type VI secretion system amidase effector protein Tae4 n=1 Tax=Cupriavidus pauculus TaxID=82633 RepID=UPI00203AFFDF|nr:type VI secretion system amidase effector protein Tae4 [Cupriavidus pauculus]MCM3604093.1 type VI secretion system amidase effector protein Tae4 [Cupriavidus pauculus]